MIEIGYNFDKKSSDKIKRFKNPVLNIYKNKINRIVNNNLKPKVTKNKNHI